MARKEKIHVRMTNEQYQRIKERAERCKLPMSEYLRLASMGDGVVLFEGMGDVRREIRKIEVNLKQLEKLRDEGELESSVLGEELSQARELIDELWQLLKL